MALTEIDRSLLKRCISGEPGAWKDFVDRFIGLFVHVVNHTAHARSVRLRPEDVDDLCSEVFLALVSNDFRILRQFRGKSSLATYLTVVARRIVVKEMARRRMAEALGHVSHRHGEANVSEKPSRQTADRDRVERMLHRLSQPDAEVVRQFHLEGRSYHEISTALGIPENSIGPMLSRARARLRRQKD